MAKGETPDDGFGLGAVDVTVVVVQGRVQVALTKALGGRRRRAALASVGLIAALAAGAIIAVSSGSGRASPSAATPSPRLRESDAIVTRFGLRLTCPRLTLVSPDGAYARVDFEHTTPCGMYGNHITAILHRVHGVWRPEFEGSIWTCPMGQLPRPVVTELQLCRPG